MPQDRGGRVAGGRGRGGTGSGDRSPGQRANQMVTEGPEPYKDHGFNPKLII